MSTLPEPRRLNHVPTRAIPRSVERELWARAGGRCQFNGHNLILYRSPMTQERLSIAEKAHIYSFSNNGPRGHESDAGDDMSLNDADNLLLVCASCHLEIDHQNGTRFPAELLKAWKADHEHRIELVTGIHPQNRTCIVLFSENIGDQKTAVHAQEAAEAVFPELFPAEARPTTLSMTWEGKDTDPGYWSASSANLAKAFEKGVTPLVAEGRHISVFGLAPIPLLIMLGTLFTDKTNLMVHQLRREPRSWKWSDDGHEDLGFSLTPPARTGGSPALIISLSDHVPAERTYAILGSEASVWALTVRQPHNDLITSRQHLSAFRKFCRQAMVDITRAHGHQTPLHIFPAMPVSTAIEFGRIRMPKSQMPWNLYDYNQKFGNFVHALTLG